MEVKIRAVVFLIAFGSFWICVATKHNTAAMWSVVIAIGAVWK